MRVLRVNLHTGAKRERYAQGGNLYPAVHDVPPAFWVLGTKTFAEQCRYVNANSKRNCVQRVLSAAGVADAEVKIGCGANDEIGGSAVIMRQRSRARCLVPGLERPAMTPVAYFACRSRRDYSTDEGLHAPRSDVVSSERYAHAADYRDFRASLEVRERPECRERAHEIGRIRHGISEADIHIRPERSETVVKAIAPIEGEMPRAEAFRHLAGGRRPHNRGGVVKYGLFPSGPDAHEEVTYTAGERRSGQGCGAGRR